MREKLVSKPHATMFGPSITLSLVRVRKSDDTTPSLTKEAEERV